MGLKIIITGGAGFIGSAIINELKQFGNEIFVIDNLSFGRREFAQVPDSHFFKEDILNAGKMESLFQAIQPDVVLHLAAVHFIPYCNQHPFESANINIQGTMNILQAARGCKSLKKLLFASTAAVYPISDHPVNENHSTGPMDIYGLSKLAGEHLCNEFYLETKIPVIVCRFFNAFGPNETNPHLIPEIQRQVNEGVRKIQLGNLTPKRDFIHTSDMAVAIRMLLNKFESGIDVFNLGRGIEYSVSEVVTAFEKQLGEKLDVIVDTTRIRKVERMHLLADISKLSRYTGWQPVVSLEEGINTLIERPVVQN
jgi:UDP-glucose 4-epimerase